MGEETARTQPGSLLSAGESTANNPAAMLLDASEDMACLIDRQRRVCLMNRALLAHLDMTAAEVAGTSIYDYLPPSWHEGQPDEVNLVFETGEPVHTDMELNGCTVELRVFPIRDVEGTLTHCALFLRDITASVRVQEQVVQAEVLRMELQKDRDLLRKQEGFVSMVSHELRNPLAVIRGSLDILERYYDRLDDSRRRKHFNRIGQQVESMKAMLQDLLAMRQAEASGFNFSPQSVHLSQCAAIIYQDIRRQTNSPHRFALVDRSPSDNVMVDPGLLRHILDNLLSNAIKYTPEDGEIRLELDHDAEWLYIRVADSGIGIPQAAQDRLFEPFFRAGNTDRIEGTGLGLVIAQTCVSAHGGEITFESVEGRGTTFVVRLPRVDAPGGHDAQVFSQV